MDTVNWKHTGEKFQKQADELSDLLGVYFTEQGYGIETMNALAFDVIAKVVSTCLDPRSYAARQAVKDDQDVPEHIRVGMYAEPKEASAYIDVQSERVRYILEEYVSRDYGVPLEKLRNRRH